MRTKKDAERSVETSVAATCNRLQLRRKSERCGLGSPALTHAWEPYASVRLESVRLVACMRPCVHMRVAEDLFHLMPILTPRYGKDRKVR